MLDAPIGQRHAEQIRLALNALHHALAQLHVVLSEFGPPERIQRGRRDAVAGEVPVQRMRGGVPRLPGIAYQDATPATAEHQRRAEPGRTASNHHDIEHGESPLQLVRHLAVAEVRWAVVLVSEFDFELPPELIAQEAPAARGTSRLLRMRREDGALAHHSMRVLR